MPNVPPKFQGGKGVPSIDKRTTAGNGGFGSSDDMVYKNLPNYERNLVTSGKRLPDTRISAGGYGKNSNKPWSRQPEGPISTGGVKQGKI